MKPLFFKGALLAGMLASAALFAQGPVMTKGPAASKGLAAKQGAGSAAGTPDLVHYVNTLQGTNSSFELTGGNT